MKKWIGNILIRLLLNADNKYIKFLYESLENNNVRKKQNIFKSLYTISDTFKFNGININFYGNGDIFCGEKSYIGEWSTIQAFDGCNVIIGNNCAISHNVRIYTSSYNPDQDFNGNKPKLIKIGNVKIGNGVWIGANVFINPGVEIGDNVVIGANSVVTKNIPPNTIYGGVPAKLIRIKM